MSKKIIFYALTIIFLVVGVFVFKNLISKHLEKTERQNVLQAIVDLIPLDGVDTQHRKIDAVQSFIHEHSAHNMNEEFYALWRNSAAHFKVFKDHVTGKRAELAPMECSTRAALMRDLLKTMGFKVRSIDIFNTDENLDAHSFLEVWNDSTKTWESYDPDYNIFWKNVKTSERTSFLNTLLEPNLIIPCNQSACGWEVQSSENIRAVGLKPFRHLVTIIDRDRSERYSLFSTSVDTHKLYEKSDRRGTFCNILGKNCRNGFLPAPTYKNNQIQQF